ncbi:MAG: Druantia anti-phage system protein DruA [Desulfitobacteriia bacterium]
MKRWRSYVNQYHMLGDKWVFGSRLHYFVKSGDKELGCLQFSASAWSLEDRDQWIGWTKEDRKVRLHLIVNNSRFLIFPWVHIRNLASKALSLAVKQIQQDWLREYCYAPVLLETFVDTDHFNGTCYKASNWIYLGETKGSGRTRVESEPLSKKMIFMYPLQEENFKACLKGEEHYKVVNPE